MTAKRMEKEPHACLVPPNVLFCGHCGTKYAMALPAPVRIFAAAIDAFEREHKKCRLGVNGLACDRCFKFGHDREACPGLAYNGDPAKWLAGPDTGASSITIWRQMMGSPQIRPYEPADPADFGRCYRLLKAFPEWRARIVEMRDVPRWKPLIDNWDELEQLYEEEMASGRCPKLYARMQQLARMP